LVAFTAAPTPRSGRPVQSCNYGDGRLYRNVTIGELAHGEVVRVTDYWGEPTETPAWRQPMTDWLDMPGDGIWPDNAHLGHY
jgi:hypothetical protein